MVPWVAPSPRAKHVISSSRHSSTCLTTILLFTPHAHVPSRRISEALFTAKTNNNKGITISHLANSSMVQSDYLRKFPMTLGSSTNQHTRHNNTPPIGTSTWTSSMPQPKRTLFKVNRCEQCRQLKHKCPGEKPECSRCQRLGKRCVCK